MAQAKPVQLRRAAYPNDFGARARTHRHLRRRKAIARQCTGRREHLKAIVIFALDTFMRKSEIFKIHWKDIDLDNRLITIPAIITKTGKSRMVPVSSRLSAELATLKRSEPAAAKVFGIETDADSASDSALEAAGIDDLRFHDLRGTGITRMLRAGLLAAEVMKISGHTVFKTFLKYVRQDESGNSNAASLLDSFLAQGDKTEQNLLPPRLSLSTCLKTTN